MAAPNIFESSAPQLGGVRGTETAHRKIELQSPADLTFLVAKLTEAARERIEKQFPSSTTEGGEKGAGTEEEDAEKEKVKRRVEELVDEVSCGPQIRRGDKYRERLFPDD
jgi:kinetochor protein Mis14/NSL1